MDEDFEVRDSEITLEETMSKVRDKTESVIIDRPYTQERLAEAERLKIGDAPEQADFLRHYIKTARVLCNIDAEHYKFGIPPFLNRPILGHMVLAGKGFIRRFLRFHTRGVFGQQVEFNRHMVELAVGLADRMEKLEKEVLSLKGRKE